jgi:15-cis-phytoene synthase
MTQTMPEAAPLAGAVAECRDVLARHSKSFALAAKLLPAECRDDAAILYAWCRRADDAIDHAGSESQSAALQRLERELADVYRGATLSDPLLRAFAEVARARQIPREYPRALLAGMAMDQGPVAYATLAELITYCFRVAGTVGLMMCHVLGVRHPLALRHAADLGIGMQLTNICRDVQEDWQRGRLYLPRELLAEHARPMAISPAHAELTPELAEHLRPVVVQLLALAEQYYASGDRGLYYLAPRCAFSVHTARLVYSRIGARLGARGHDVLGGRARVSTPHKLALCLRAGFATVCCPRAHGGHFARAPLESSLSYVEGVFPV